MSLKVHIKLFGHKYGLIPFNSTGMATLPQKSQTAHTPSQLLKSIDSSWQHAIPDLIESATQYKPRAALQYVTMQLPEGLRLDNCIKTLRIISHTPL